MGNHSHEEQIATNSKVLRQKMASEIHISNSYMIKLYTEQISSNFFFVCQQIHQVCAGESEVSFFQNSPCVMTVTQEEFGCKTGCLI